MIPVIMALSVSSAMADEDDFLLSIRDVTQTALNTIEFNLYLLDTDNTQTFEFAALQMGLLLNSSIYGTGTLTVTYSNTGSGLDVTQQFDGSVDVVASLDGYDGQTLIMLTANTIPSAPPGEGTGTVISSSGNGTLLAHFIITGSESFTPMTRPGLQFCPGTAVSPLWPTVLYAYIEGNSTQLEITPGLNAVVDGDPMLVATTPAIFNVTGTGSYCEGGTGLTAGLDGSELAATYTLYRNGAEVTTLSGTGSAISFGNQTAGTYTIYASNAAGSVRMTGQAVITENPVNTFTLTSGAGTDIQNVCLNAPITIITYATTGATDIGEATGLPEGVTVSWSANTITVTGIPTESGTFDYSVPLTGGCGTVSATGTITVSTCTKTLNLTLFLEGLYNGTNGLVKVQDCVDGETSFDLFAGDITDTLTVELARTTDPYNSVFIQHGVPISVDGTISLTTIPGDLTDSYFIVIKHRNHLETWSQSLSLAGSIVNYDFTDAVNKAWGNNMVLVGSDYCLYTGDTNNDEYVDAYDLMITFNLTRSSGFGYQVSDVNADGFIDIYDLLKVFNNNRKSVGMNTPLAPMK